MDSESRDIDQSYTRALAVAAGQVAAVLFLAALVLDGGVMFRAGLVALLAYLAMLVVIVARRPYQATPSDIVAIKCGFLLIYSVFILVVTTSH